MKLDLETGLNKILIILLLAMKNLEGKDSIKSRN